MSKLTRFKKGAGVKPVTYAPLCCLKFKGKLDSKKGSTVADACIAKYMSKCAANEGREAIMAENILSNDRKEAAVTITVLQEKKTFLNNAPSQNTASDASSIRENRRNSEMIRSAKTAIERCCERLNTINESIINIDTVLDERILKTRKKACQKINAYISGLRAGKLKDYEIELNFCDDARLVYHQKHRFGDEAITKAIENRHMED